MYIFRSIIDGNNTFVDRALIQFYSYMSHLSFLWFVTNIEPFIKGLESEIHCYISSDALNSDNKSSQRVKINEVRNNLPYVYLSLPQQRIYTVYSSLYKIISCPESNSLLICNFNLSLLNFCSIQPSHHTKFYRYILFPLSH